MPVVADESRATMGAHVAEGAQHPRRLAHHDDGGRELVALGRYPWHGALGRFGPRDSQKVEEALTLTSLDALSDRTAMYPSRGDAATVLRENSCLIY
jgi:ABC-type cobalamin/Fe3+-siderophores transport system ATPase subunit